MVKGNNLVSYNTLSVPEVAGASGYASHSRSFFPAFGELPPEAAQSVSTPHSPILHTPSHGMKNILAATWQIREKTSGCAKLARTVGCFNEFPLHLL